MRLLLRQRGHVFDDLTRIIVGLVAYHVVSSRDVGAYRAVLPRPGPAESALWYCHVADACLTGGSDRLSRCLCAVVPSWPGPTSVCITRGRVHA